MGKGAKKGDSRSAKSGKGWNDWDCRRDERSGERWANRRGDPGDPRDESWIFNEWPDHSLQTTSWSTGGKTQANSGDSVGKTQDTYWGKVGRTHDDSWGPIGKAQDTFWGKGGKTQDDSLDRLGKAHDTYWGKDGKAQGHSWGTAGTTEWARRRRCT